MAYSRTGTLTAVQVRLHVHLPTHPAPRLSQVLPLIFSVVLIRYYSSMAGLSPARGLAYTRAVRTQPDHASSYHCLHAPPPSHHTSAASHHSPSPPPPGTPPLDAPPADASSPDAQAFGMLPLVCCRSRAAARRVTTRRPRCATQPRTADRCHRHSPHSHALATATVSSSYHCRPNLQQR